MRAQVEAQMEKIYLTAEAMIAKGKPESAFTGVLCAEILRLTSSLNDLRSTIEKLTDLAEFSIASSQEDMK